MSYLDRIRACNAHRPENFRPFAVVSRQVGWIRHAFARSLERFPRVFTVTDSRVSLADDLITFKSRTDALDEVVRALVEEGRIARYLGERYPVTADGREQALLLLDRAAAPHFGIRAFGQHLNGYVRRDGATLMWVARRALNKWNFPGKLDNLVAGGLPYALSLNENLRKECREEASIPAALVDRARPVGAVSYCLETDAGLKPDTMYCYDLELPVDFEPHAGDGEVEGFELLALERVAELVRETEEFKMNCDLVVIDFLIRHGFIGPHEPGYLELVRGLRRRPQPARGTRGD